jgi:hypothetical protein
MQQPNDWEAAAWLFIMVARDLSTAGPTRDLAARKRKELAMK